ncbi:purine-binding chemotaxis protein CheW [Symbiobacterium terraclitae]|uniref:Purine-binding chemotaxis protein CheW n=1 Tax=Symbiobacterium terraclitae TaxID=557451 RepID=A0ABS4JW01_9FIRM|nr:chemotaxis protein CheW [Symbiobacterium terraclitae]MBP2019718.1 purine-binding chemotaxis protein CheW [Symbiobacterium terraclitae]
MAEASQYVIFRMDDQLYGADIAVVREVSYRTPVTRLPNAPHYVEGVIDLRGEVMPIIDLRKRLGLPGRPADGDTRIMVLSAGGITAAVIVDGVEQVISIDADTIAQPDSSVAVAGQDYVYGVARMDGRLVVLIDLSRLLSIAVA